eukprot:TRINITY_DN11865_c1_g8_i6.p1 TRINITY_DN11865_c1_g8~~TRINITY_DN11865_c1_g8_i6.p1  ORF type:complete len:153 (+),score=36.88 TRINITY_DN11865_c1_g8_i6:583-1041(+)
MVPVSGAKGDNILESHPDLSSWYTGPTLVQAIDELEPVRSDIAAPLRVAVSDVFKGRGSNNVAVTGRVLAGACQQGDAIMALPNTCVASIKSMTANDSEADHALAGDAVMLTLSGPDLEPDLLRYHDGIFTSTVAYHLNDSTRLLLQRTPRQ